jgi:flagellar hook-basal body complex protein FliE
MIPPIAPLAGITSSIPSVGAAGAAAPADPSALAGGQSAEATGGNFSNVVSNAVDALQNAQSTAATDEAQAAAGQGNLADTMVAATQSSLDTEVTTSLLNQATTAYNSILNMSF